MQVPFPFFKSYRSHQVSLSKAVVLGMTCLLLGSCSQSRRLPALTEAQTATLDSTAFFGDDTPSEFLIGKFPQHQCNTQKDSLLGMDVLHLTWWKGPALSERKSFPWPAGKPNNLDSVEALGGISIWIKKTGPSQSDPVIIFELEDHSGMRSSTSLAARHIPTFPLDTVWQEARIPLSDFRRGRNQTDWSDLASFNLRMEHFGDVEIGACQLVPHAPIKKVVRRASKRPHTEIEPGRFIVFEENTDHEWGLGEFGPDRQFIINEKRGRSKSQALDFEWDFSPAPLTLEALKFPTHTVGFSWNQWQALAPPAQPDAAFIVFKLRNIGVNPGPTAPLPIEVGVADADGNTSSMALTQDLISAKGFGKWMECRIPMNAFEWATEDDPSGLGSIEYIYFQFSEKGHVYIDDLSVRF